MEVRCNGLARRNSDGRRLSPFAGGREVDGAVRLSGNSRGPGGLKVIGSRGQRLETVLTLGVGYRDFKVPDEFAAALVNLHPNGLDHDIRQRLAGRSVDVAANPPLRSEAYRQIAGAGAAERNRCEFLVVLGTEAFAGDKEPRRRGAGVECDLEPALLVRDRPGSIG